MLKLKRIALAATIQPLLLRSFDHGCAEPRLAQSERQIGHSTESEQLLVDGSLRMFPDPPDELGGSGLIHAELDDRAGRVPGQVLAADEIGRAHV